MCGKMASEAQAKVQQAVEKMLNDVERQRLRPLLVRQFWKEMCSGSVKVLILIILFSQTCHGKGYILREREITSV